jgi:MFS family permease
MQSQAVALPLDPLQSDAGTGANAAALAPSWIAGILLSVIGCLPVASILLIAQVLPQIETAFAAAPGVKILAPVALAIPSLMTGIFSLPAGWLTDRAGRTRMLMICLGLYGVLGIAPVFLTNLHAIIATRAAMGVVDAGIITSSTALLGNLYHGLGRARWLSVRAAVTSAAAIFCAAFGGYMGDFSWRAPFWCFTASLLLFPLAAIFIRDRPDAAHVQHAVLGQQSYLPWRPLAGPCLFALVMAFGIYVTQMNLPLLMHHIGVKIPHRIGLAASFTHVGSLLGTMTFALAARRDHGSGSIAINIAVTLLVGLGLTILGLAPTYDGIALGGFIACYGAAFGFPCMTNRLLRVLAHQQYGLGIGIWECCFNIGVFAVPLTVLAMAGIAGGLGQGIALLGGLCSLAALLQATIRGTAFRQDSPTE